jgi:hypothetical protein
VIHKYSSIKKEVFISATSKSSKYKLKLLDIQRALTLIDTDIVWLVTINKEMAFHLLPEILADFDLRTEEIEQLQADNIQLNLQNDSLLYQNIFLTQQLNRQ